MTAETVNGQHNSITDSTKKWFDSILVVEQNKQTLSLVDSFNNINSSSIKTLEEIKKNSAKDQLTNNIITILLALVAAFIALYQVKSNVSSNYRIKWVEDLRHNLSEFLEGSQRQQSLFADIVGKQKRMGKMEYPDFWEDFKVFNETQSGNIRMHSKLKLYLTSQNPLHKAIEEKLDEIQAKLKITQPNLHTNENADDIANLVDETIDLAKNVFEEELDKSKKMFRI